MATRRRPRHAEHIATHDDAAGHRRSVAARGALRAGLLGWLAGCSTLPPATLPPFADHQLLAHFEVPADGRLPLPSSDGSLVVHALVGEPPPLAEEFGPLGHRWWRYAPGTRVVVRASMRSYGDRGLPPASAAALLPGALHVQSIDAR